MSLEKVIFFTFLVLTKHASSYPNEELVNNVLEKLNEYQEENKRDIQWLKHENEKLKSQNHHLGDKIINLEQENKHLKNDINSIQTNANSVYEAPLGSIIAWTPMPDADTLNPTSLPEGWVLCDGSVIDGGIWDGRKTPNLNGEKRFLRGYLSMSQKVIQIQNRQFS